MQTNAKTREKNAKNPQKKPRKHHKKCAGNILENIATIFQNSLENILEYSRTCYHFGTHYIKKNTYFGYGFGDFGDFYKKMSMSKFVYVAMCIYIFVSTFMFMAVHIVVKYFFSFFTKKNTSPQAFTCPKMAKTGKNIRKYTEIYGNIRYL